MSRRVPRSRHPHAPIPNPFDPPRFSAEEIAETMCVRGGSEVRKDADPLRRRKPKRPPPDDTFAGVRLC